MNTKVINCHQLYNMQLHKAKRIVSLVDKYLPKRFYTAEVIKRCNEKNLTITEQIVRDVKNFRTKNERVLDIIIEVAIESQKAHKNIEENLKPQ